MRSNNSASTLAESNTINSENGILAGPSAPNDTNSDGIGSKNMPSPSACAQAASREHSGASDSGGDRQRRRTCRYQQIASQNCGSDEIAPLCVHFQYTIMEKRTSIAPSARTGVLRGLVHSGFCVPARCRVRISCNRSEEHTSELQ